MCLRIRGKGNKERQVPLSEPTLESWRAFWKLHRSKPWLFPSRLQDGHITFRYRDNRTQQIKRLQLTAGEFVQRWLQHVLPKGFAKVRHYGLDSSACAERRAAALALLQANQDSTPESTTSGPPLPAPPLDPPQSSGRCPYCGREIVCLWNLWPSRKIPP
jgi:hypothetical protein